MLREAVCSAHQNWEVIHSQLGLPDTPKDGGNPKRNLLRWGSKLAESWHIYECDFIHTLRVVKSGDKLYIAK